MEGFGYDLDRGDGFFDFAVCAVDAGQVSVCVVAAVEDWGAANDSFCGYEDVVAVDEDWLGFQGCRWDVGLEAGLELGVGAGGTHQGGSLASGEGEMVAYQLQGTFGGVLHCQQEGKVRDRPFEAGEYFGAESGAVLWVFAAMSSFVGHDYYYNCVTTA